MPIPQNYIRLEGSKRVPRSNARKSAPADPQQQMSVSIRVRRRAGAPPLPSMEDWARTPILQRKYLTRAELAAQYGADAADLHAIATFAGEHGLTVRTQDAARRIVLVSGSVAQMSKAFAVELATYTTGEETYRGREGYIYVPKALAGVIEAVFGLDNRRMARRHDGHFDASPLTPPQVARLYHFPDVAGGQGQTIGILEFSDAGDPTGYDKGDLKGYFDGLGVALPSITDVPIDGGGNTQADGETTLDVIVAGGVAQGADIAVYFSVWSQKGWVDAVTTAVHDTANEPTVLSMSYGWPEFQTIDGLDWTAAAMDAVSQTFQEAAALGVTVFVSTGDNGSDCGIGDGSAHVLFPCSNPWATACGGTSLQDVSGSSFNEKTWTSTGGGISDYYDVPSWQKGANIPASANPGARVGRGVPDIAANSDPNSGYDLPSFGQTGGTSAAAPLYAGLVALMNAALGTRVGFLNPTLYALAGTNVIRDINDGASNASGGAPGYTTGAGWDACTGLGVIDGQALLSAISGGLEKKLTLITDKATFGKDEVFTLLELSTGVPPSAAFPRALYVTVDGFTPDDLGIVTIHPTPAQLAQWAPAITTGDAVTGVAINVPGMSIIPQAVLSEDPTLGDHVQRFTFYYAVSFANNDAFANPAKFPGGKDRIEVIATLAAESITSGGFVELILQPNPYEMDGSTSWLSTDLRVFRTLAGGHKFGATMGNGAADAPAFIQQVISNLNSGNTNGQTFEDNLSLDPDVSALTIYEQEDGQPVFNFAVARVRYVSGNTDILKPPGVRVFFRMFQQSSTRMNFDPAHTYRTIDQGGSSKIPSLGVQGLETVSIPFFAADRVDTTQVSLSQQHDDPNVREIDHDASGNTVFAYFGCWLDFNQSGPKRFPITPFGSLDGPYTGVGFPFLPGEPLPIMQLVRGHQCLVAEISYDPDPITVGDTPAASDKLAQRNLSIIGSDNPGSPASHRIPNTFDIRPTPAPLPAGLPPDELMIDWGATPVGSVASIYLPGADAHAILQTAAEMYATHRLTQVDAHTLQTRTGGATFIPIPSGPDAGFAGLLTIDLPSNVHKGQEFNVVVHQLSNAQGSAPVGRTLPKLPRGHRHADASPRAAVSTRRLHWRQVIGSFQIKIPVSTKRLLLPEEERNLSVFRWIFEAIPKDNRWYLVFERYLQQLADRVEAFGGVPGRISPSPLGDGKPWPPKWHPPTGPGSGGESHHGATGKVSGVIYDRFGDFDGFSIETLHGDERCFVSRERAVESIVIRAWRERLLVRIETVEKKDHRPAKIVLLAPPAMGC